MERDRAIICNIISTMLDDPDEHEIYPTSTAYTALEHYIEEARVVALGYAHAYMCSLLDKGIDPRLQEVPVFLEQAMKDLSVSIGQPAPFKE